VIIEGGEQLGRPSQGRRVAARGPLRYAVEGFAGEQQVLEKDHQSLCRGEPRSPILRGRSSRRIGSNRNRVSKRLRMGSKPRWSEWRVRPAAWAVSPSGGVLRRGRFTDLTPGGLSGWEHDCWAATAAGASGAGPSRLPRP